MTAKGYVCMGFDYRGFKPSEGREKYTTLEREVEDVAAAVNFMKAQPEIDPQRIGFNRLGRRRSRMCGGHGKRGCGKGGCHT